MMPWDETQAIYHALAQTGEEGLVICRPSSRCVCLGLHDDLAQEVDEGYCRKNGLPLIRRDIGGGTVLLEPGQIFFQLVLSRKSPLLTGSRNHFFARFLQPAVSTLADFQLSASVAPPADIVVNGRKISGNGAGDINGMAVYTGNLLVSFDRRTMAGVLKLPDARCRELMQSSLDRFLTTMEEELGYAPEFPAVEERLIKHFSAWLGELEPACITDGLKQAVQSAARTLTDREFLDLPGKRNTVRQVKISEGTYLRFRPAEDQQAFAALLVRNGRTRELEGAGLSREPQK